MQVLQHLSRACELRTSAQPHIMPAWWSTRLCLALVLACALLAVATAQPGQGGPDGPRRPGTPLLWQSRYLCLLFSKLYPYMINSGAKANLTACSALPRPTLQ